MKSFCAASFLRNYLKEGGRLPIEGRKKVCVFYLFFSGIGVKILALDILHVVCYRLKNISKFLKIKTEHVAKVAWVDVKYL